MTRDLRLLLLSGCIGIVVLILTGAIAVQVNDYEDGNVLTAGELNSEFGNIYSTLNNLDEENFADGFQLTPEFIDSALAGLGLIQNPVSKALDIQVDDSTVEISTDTLQVKDLGISTAKINDLAVTEAKIANNAVTSAKIPTDAIGASEIAADAVGASELANNSVASANIIDGTIATADIANGAVTREKTVDLNVDNDGSGNFNSVVISNGTGTGSMVTNGITGSASVSTSLTFTSQGSVVALSIVPSSSIGSSYFKCVDKGGKYGVRIQRGASTVFYWEMDCDDAIGGTQVCNNSGTIDLYKGNTAFDDAPSGTHTYTLTFSITNAFPGVEACNFSNVALSAREL